MKHARLGVVTLAVTVIVLYMATARAAEGDLATQTSSEGGVTVSVKPASISAGVGSWDFDVTLSTHAVELNQDLQSVSVLIDAGGKPHGAVSWEGDPPGGHHRKGVLRFKPLAVLPSSLELRISGVGGVGARVFRWQLQ